MAELLRALVWRSLSYPGAEYFTLFKTTTGFQLEGRVVVGLNNSPFYTHYQVTCDPHWRTTRAVVELARGSATHSLEIAIDPDRRWRVDGQEIEDVRGCLDIDLSVTPSTNTLPIRRLDLGIGGSQEVVAAWLRFPELKLEPLPQAYTRLAAHEYRYESRSGHFTSELEVDELGLVVRYAKGWQREAVALS